MKNKNSKKIQKEILFLKEQREELIDYVENIDDRNSIKLQVIKNDIDKIMKKDFQKINNQKIKRLDYGK